jgi:hypothetical protein
MPSPGRTSAWAQLIEIWRLLPTRRNQLRVACLLTADLEHIKGHLVQMDDVAWNHVVEQHVEMSEYLAETMNAIKTPDHREPDPRAGRERFFRKGGPEHWIRAVTEFSGDADRVVTAFPQSEDPRQRGWRR